MLSLSGRRSLPQVLAGYCLPVLVLLAGAVPVRAQMQGDPDDVAGRLGRLESEVATLNRIARSGGNGSGEGLAPAQATQIELRLSRLERSVQEIMGKYEETVFGVTQMRERLDKLSNDVDYRLSTLEGGGAVTGAGAAKGPPPPPPKTPQAAQPPQGHPTAKLQSADPPPPAPLAAGTSTSAQEQYDEAFSILRRGDYDRAEKALGSFVVQHKDSPLAGNAQYWLAETYYVRGKYAEAAVAFAEGYKKYPKNPKAPDNLLKLGMSLASLNQKDDACKTFAQLSSQFGATAASLKRRADQERKHLNCPGG